MPSVTVRKESHRAQPNSVLLLGLDLADHPLAAPAKWSRQRTGGGDPSLPIESLDQASYLGNNLRTTSPFFVTVIAPFANTVVCVFANCWKTL